jgi:tricorn protease
MFVAMLAFTLVSPALEDARLMRFPDIADGKIVFTYAGDLWLVTEAGGIARKLTNHPGGEALAKFSPDGKRIAFTASYDGNTDVFVMPSEGGEPKRLTFHPANDAVVDWSPDGKWIYFRSIRSSNVARYLRLFKVPADGGTATELPMDECGLASASPDGATFAYNRMATENAAWKRYRGGLQSFISFYDVKNGKYWEMEHDKSAYLWPMWSGGTVYYANDSDGRYNLYAYDVAAKKSKKLTGFSDFDIKWPSIGGGKIVFERDAKLWTYDIASGDIRNVPVQIATDLPDARPYRMDLSSRVSDLSISPSGARVVLEARGELFSVPVKEGLTHNITKSAGARERFPRWSPDGKWILFSSDKSGEYEFYIEKSDLSGPATQVTSGSTGFRNDPTWSPDSKSFFFTDSTSTLKIVEVESRKETVVGRSEFQAYGDAVWSPDSKWLAYSKADASGFAKVFLYSVESGKEQQVTAGLFDDKNPVFDVDGKYLYFVSTREINPNSGMLELSFNVSNADRIFGVTLRKELPGPFAPKNDEEITDAPGEKPKPEEKKALVIETEGMGSRLFSIPLPGGGYQLVGAPSGRLLYATGGALMQYEFASKSAQPIIEGVAGAALTPKMDKLAYMSGSTVGVVPVAPGQKVGAGKVNTGDMETVVDPRAEWKQSYWEAWRYERDYYWNPYMNGIDWRAIGEKYARWLPYLGHRSDLDYLLRELLGELATGHAYVIPGPVPGGRSVPIGLLGADYEISSSGVRFKKVYRGHAWDSGRRAPLNEPGMNISDGDYLVAIDGERVTADTNVEEFLVGKADKLVEISVNTKPGLDGARKVLVRPVGDESGIRYADWVDSRLKYVTEKTGGRVAYVHVPSTGQDGIVEFYKMFYPQVEKEAIIVDERFNSGGFIPDFFIEKLSRTALSYWTPRNQGDFRSPGAAVLGPKVMLINHYGGSGGDAFPYYFRKKGLGPLIGTRTWGGLVGIFGNRDLMAGGAVTVPQFAVWDVDAKGQSKWVVENEGVSPDIELDNRPDLVAAGKDPQLDKAIEVIMESLRKNPVVKPRRPAYRGG